MIKHLLTTLCALALVTAGSIPALAAEADTSESTRYYPISVEEYTYGEQNEPRINKVYQLSLSDNPVSPQRISCGMGGYITCWI